MDVGILIEKARQMPVHWFILVSRAFKVYPRQGNEISFVPKDKVLHRDMET